MKQAIPIVVVLIASILAAVGFWASRPRVDAAPRMNPAVPVEIIEMAFQDVPVWIPAMGTVLPSRELVVLPEVSGRITSLAQTLHPGGYIHKGDILVTIDDRDYRALITQARSRMIEAETTLELERGRQAVAKEEWELMSSSMDVFSNDRRLALRGPQLANAEAAVESAKSFLEQARLNLSRTVIRAPFNAIVKVKSVEIGQLVTPQTVIATLIGADQYWVQVSLPTHQIEWIQFPTDENGTGSTVRIHQSIGTGKHHFFEWTGRVISLYSDLSQAGRLARVLVEIDDPLHLDDGPSSLPLLLNAVVNVEIEGPLLHDAVVLPRDSVREGNRVWLVGEDNRLIMRPISITLRRDTDILIKSGIKQGDRIITSSIASPVEGMQLRIVEQLNTRMPPQSEQPLVSKSSRDISPTLSGEVRS